MEIKRKNTTDFNQLTEVTEMKDSNTQCKQQCKMILSKKKIIVQKRWQKT